MKKHQPRVDSHFFSANQRHDKTPFSFPPNAIFPVRNRKRKNLSARRSHCHRKIKVKRLAVYRVVITPARYQNFKIDSFLFPTFFYS